MPERPKLPHHRLGHEARRLSRVRHVLWRRLLARQVHPDLRLVARAVGFQPTSLAIRYSGRVRNRRAPKAPRENYRFFAYSLRRGPH